MTADPAKILLYSQDTFDIANPSPPQVQAMLDTAGSLAAAGFGTVVLGQWHVASDGTFAYNDSPLDTVLDALKLVPRALMTGGGVTHVPICFGPFASDFQGIKDNQAAFQSTVEMLVEQCGITGIDWDLEQDYGDFTDLVVDLTTWAVGRGLTVTAAPYTDPSFWVDVLRRTGGGSGFAWWNLQLYGGADYLEWVGYLDGVVPEPQAFLVPGYNAAYETPSDVQQDLAQQQAQAPGLAGGFVWKFEDFGPSGMTAQEYASAIREGVGG